MKSGEIMKIPFRVIITKPGVYNLNCLRFQLGVVSTLEDTNLIRSEEVPIPPAFDEDELIPLKLSFVVTNVSNVNPELVKL